MISIGQVVMKLAGRDAGRIGVIIDIPDKQHVLIDGETRRRTINVNHIDFTGRKVDVKPNASTEEVRDALRGLGYEFSDKKREPREKKDKPVPARTQKAAERVEQKQARKAAKKAPAKKAPAKKAVKKTAKKTAKSESP